MCVLCCRVPSLDLEHNCRVRELGCRWEWDAERKLLRVFPQQRPSKHAAKGGEAGGSVALAQLMAVRVRVRVAFGGRGAPSLAIEFLPAEE